MNGGTLGGDPLDEGIQRMMIDVEVFLTVIAGFVLLMFVCYSGGLLASRGWHKGKLEFVNRLRNDYTEEEPSHGQKSTQLRLHPVVRGNR